MSHATRSRFISLATLLLAVGVIWAGGPVTPCGAAPSAADKARARALARAAKRLALRKQYRPAIARLRAAYRYWPNRKILFNMALIYLQMGDKLNAYEHLQRFLEASPPGTAAKLPDVLLRLVSQVGTLRVVSPLPDLDIYVNGVRRGRGRIRVAVLPGRYRVELRQGERIVLQKALRVRGGAVVVWEAGAVNLTAPRPRPRGRATADAPSGRRGSGGAHKSRRHRPGVRKKLHWAYFAAAGGVAVLAAGAMVGTGVKTLQIGDQFQRNASQALADEGNRYKLATNILIGVSAAAGITAAVLAFFTRWKSETPEADERRVRVRPGVAPGGASLTLDIRF